MAYTVAITNQKGGVGKTTTAVNLAAALAIADRRTLLVDADPQGNTTSGVGIAKLELQVSLYDVLVDEHPVHDVILPVPGLRHLSVLPATQDLVGAELQLVERPFRESALRRVLEPLEREYDYIVVDCPPSLGLLTLNVLAAVQQLIIPIQCEYYGLEGISQLLNTVRLVQQNINPGLAIGGVLLTMYDSRLNLCRQVAEDATEYFGPKVFGAPIPRNVRLAEAPSFGKPILLYDVQSVGAKSYLAVAQELLRRVEGVDVTIAPAQVAAATSHAATAAMATSNAAGSAEAEADAPEAAANSEESTSGDMSDAPVAAEPPAAHDEEHGALPPIHASSSEETTSLERAEEVVPADPLPGTADMPADSNVAVDAGDPTVMPRLQEIETLDSVEADAPQATEASGASPESETRPTVESAQTEAEQPNETPAVSGEQETVSATAAPVGSDAPPPESADDEASRRSHHSSESRPEVIT